MTDAPSPTPSASDWRTPEVDDLCDALLGLRSRDEVAAFLRDVCSLHELDVLSHRWHAARLLDQGVPYAQVAQRVHGSTTTVTRVAHWLRHGEGGYRLALDRRAKKR
ncbi:MAG: YerC/YecD family TrpR-related protein [Gaiellales bacterium]